MGDTQPRQPGFKNTPPAFGGGNDYFNNIRPVSGPYVPPNRPAVDPGFIMRSPSNTNPPQMGNPFISNPTQTPRDFVNQIGFLKRSFGDFKNIQQDQFGGQTGFFTSSPGDQSNAQPVQGKDGWYFVPGNGPQIVSGPATNLRNQQQPFDPRTDLRAVPFSQPGTATQPQGDFRFDTFGNRRARLPGQDVRPQSIFQQPQQQQQPQQIYQQNLQRFSDPNRIDPIFMAIVSLLGRR